MTVNSRPITYVYENNEVEPLCPSHLMIGRRLQSNPCFINNDDDEICELTYSDFNRRRRYLESLLDMYWKRFSTDYMYELREQHKYASKKAGKDVLVVGDIVLIKDDDMLPRGRWKQGILTRLIVGKDGRVRGAAVRCIVKGKPVEYERPIQRLIPFEIAPESTPDLEVPNIPETTAPNPLESSAVPETALPRHSVIDRDRPPTRIRRRAAIVGENVRRRENQS